MTVSPHLRTGLAAWLLLGAAATAPAVQAQEAGAIEQADVERIVSTLASDAMRGRGSYTQDAVRAAEYLAGEFEAAGLQTVEGADGYLQRFSVQTLNAGQAQVVVNGRPIYPDQYSVRATRPSFSWSTGDVPVVVVGPEDDPMQMALDVVTSGTEAMILIHPDHAEQFRIVAQVFRRPVVQLEGSEGPTTVVVLADGDASSTFRVNATARYSEQPLVNVVGMLPGRRSDEKVLFSAHYDHIGIQRALDGDSIANGANDDASGTAAVVELARHFAARGTPERSLLFAAFAAEEVGGFGSRYFSSRLDPDEIVAMFNIEMIGKPAVEGPNTAWITGFERSSFGRILQDAVSETEYKFYPDPYPQLDLFYRSDNATLAALGVPAHSISTTPIDVDPDYHMVTDEVETLDMAHLTNTIRAIAAGAETIVSGEATPTRVDPATVN